MKGLEIVETDGKTTSIEEDGLPKQIRKREKEMLVDS
jgi:hypothetical protein